GAPQLVQRVFEADRVSARIIQPCNLRRQAAELLADVLARGGKIGDLIDQLVFAEDGNEQVAVFHIGRNLRRLLGLKVYNYARFSYPMIDFVNRVGDESAVRLMKPPHL